MTKKERKPRNPRIPRANPSGSGSSYIELLRHPKWQRKRLEILQLARFACTECGADDKPLHVHHGYYARGAKPWEYPDHSLHALCEGCHAARQQRLEQVRRLLGRLANRDLEMVCGFVLACIPTLEECHVVESVDALDGVRVGLGLSYRETLTAISSGEMWRYSIPSEVVKEFEDICNMIEPQEK